MRKGTPDVVTNIDRVGRADELHKEIDALGADQDEMFAGYAPAGVAR